MPYPGAPEPQAMPSVFVWNVFPFEARIQFMEDGLDDQMDHITVLAFTQAGCIMDFDSTNGADMQTFYPWHAIRCIDRRF